MLFSSQLSQKNTQMDLFNKKNIYNHQASNTLNNIYNTEHIDQSRDLDIYL